MFIGIDDTDSERGLCTTYLAAVLMERLVSWGEIEGLPRLIRLNPCARYKTRGNAALAFSLKSSRPDMVKRIALQTLLELSDFSGSNTNPGLVIAEEVTERMRAFYRSAVTEILSIDSARRLLDEEGIWYRGFKKGRGLIGALAAVGADLPDWTYELIAYRQRSRWGTPRFIDPATVWEADRLTYPQTWDTVDHHNQRVVFAPHSADPVLFGIRGSDPVAIKRAFETIRSEPVERYVLYQTNQGTDAHILEGQIGRTKDSQSYRLHGFVAGPGVFETTLTRPDLFADYYLEQFRLLVENHGVALQVGSSTQPIPVHFALPEHDYLEGHLGPERRRLLRDHFDLPDLAAMDDGIANGTFEPGPRDPQPLALFTAPRVDYSLQRLRHYTGTAPEHFQNFVLFTNYQFYIDEFV
ncbi:MAG TPA: DUF1743 domain-containing protein, partial [Methanothrix soehngenii]|nr:DUF1743 domain-containing protein [Methanothrix soehngenii]